MTPLDVADRVVIETANLHHNKARLPIIEDRRCRMYVQLIRDADKLDILRVVQERLLGKHGSGTFTLPKGDDISSKVLLM